MKNTVLVILSCIIVLYGCAMQRDVITLDDRQAVIEKKYWESKQKNKELASRLDAQKKNAQDISYAKRMIEICDRKIKIKTGTKTQSVNICTEKLQRGGYCNRPQQCYSGRCEFRSGPGRDICVN